MKEFKKEGNNLKVIKTEVVEEVYSTDDLLKQKDFIEQEKENLQRHYSNEIARIEERLLEVKEMLQKAKKLKLYIEENK